MGCGSLRTKDSHNTKPSSEVNSACLRLNNELYRITKVQLGIKSKYLKFRNFLIVKLSNNLKKRLILSRITIFG